VSSALDPSPGRPGPATPSSSAVDDAEARLQARLAELGGLDGRALALHAELYEVLHTELQAVLAEIDGA
jgi:hypothetical protein